MTCSMNDLRASNMNLCEKDKSRPTGFIGRLGRDIGGNVFAMTAAAVVPMLGLVGGAVDASRLYLTRTRLQAACDSAVLAGRKAMSTATFDATAQQRANAMFDFNFQDVDYQTNGTSFTAQSDLNGKLDGRARTNVPMTLMKMFGFQDKTMNVVCSADIQIPNIDVVFVLDVTGSMDEEIDGVKRIDGLKAAAKNFYTTLKTQLDTQGLNAGQIRYGFVPYSQTVNVKDLFTASPNASAGELPLSQLVSNMVVESRVANFTPGGGWIDDPDEGDITYDQTYSASRPSTIRMLTSPPYNNDNSSSTKMSNADCDWYAENLSFNIGDSSNRNVFLYPYTSWPGDQGRGYSSFWLDEGSSTPVTEVPDTSTAGYLITFSRQSNEWNDNNGALTNKYAVCKRRVTMKRYIRNDYTFSHWTYKPVTYNVSTYNAGAGIQYVTGFKSDYVAPGVGPYDPVELANLGNTNRLNKATASWTGCIEERPTIAQTSFAPIPAGAMDMNVLESGTNDANRWRPIFDRLTYDRTRVSDNNTTTNLSAATTNCPTARIRNLNPITQSAFNTYIDSLTANGNTYLDVGMVWGLRLIAPQGMFGARNLTGPNGGQISRHVIFLTDGELVPNDSTISAYGVERMSKRITGTTGQSSATLHARRFQALCDLQRGSVSIWAIAFGTSVTNNLSNCADPDRAFEANNATELNTAFQNIAKDIADLRLVQ